MELAPIARRRRVSRCDEITPQRYDNPPKLLLHNLRGNLSKLEKTMKSAFCFQSAYKDSQYSAIQALFQEELYEIRPILISFAQISSLSHSFSLLLHPQSEKSARHIAQ